MIASLIIFLILNQTPTQAAFDCSKVKPSKELYEYIKNNYHFWNVSKEVDQLSACDKSKPPLMSEAQAKVFRDTGIMVEARYLIAKARADAKMRETKASSPQNKYIDPDQCSSVDLRNHFGPVRDQGEIGWCYAFATADFIGYKIGVDVSAVDLAINYLAEKQRSTAPSDDGKGGSLLGLIDQVNRIGICKESDSPSNLFSNSDGNEWFRSVLKNTWDESWLGQLFNQCVGSESSSSCQGEHDKLDQQGLPGQKTWPESSLYGQNSKKCKDKKLRVHLPEPKCYYKVSGDDNFQSLVIDKELTAKIAKPIYLSYHNSFLMIKSPDNDAHDSLIVGRRLNAGVCEYLIRDSYGPDCKQRNSKFKCENGNIWIPKELLFQHVKKICVYGD